MYAKHHARMLAEGVEMYEVRPDAASRHVYTRGVENAQLGLHAKLAVIDREIVYIGSFNLDPRSTFLKTEVALLVYSPALAEQVLALMERDFMPENAWRLALEPRRAGGEAPGGVDRARVRPGSPLPSRARDRLLAAVRRARLRAPSHPWTAV